MSSNTRITLKDLAGTGRGLGSLTIEDLQALLDEHTPAKPREAKVAKRGKAKAAAKKANPFYEQVIVGKREERALRQTSNREAAAWMREHGLVPQGQAWTAVKSGERGIAMLQSLNLADGLTPLAAKGSEAKAKQQEAKPAVRKARKAKAKVEPTPVAEPEVVTLDEAVAEADEAVETREEMVQALIQSGFDRATAEALIQA